MKLLDLGAIGPKFSWTNKRHGWAHVKERLDRAIGNIEWRMKFFEANFYILSAGGSDHFPILFVPNPNACKLARPFGDSMTCGSKMKNAKRSLDLDGPKIKTTPRKL